MVTSEKATQIETNYKKKTKQPIPCIKQNVAKSEIGMWKVIVGSNLKCYN